MDFLKVTVYNDPGHGWGAVKRKVLESLGILQDISHYSYQRGGTVYLEEDCDLSHLLATCQKKDIDVQFVEKYTNKRSPIRSYQSFGV